MTRTRWIAWGLVLAAVVALVGTVLVIYLQDRFGLLGGSAQIVLMWTALAGSLVLLAGCLILGLVLLWGRLRSPASRQDSDDGPRVASVQQQFEHIASGESVTGVELEELAPSTVIKVEQQATEVEGAVTGVKIGKSSETGQT